MNINSQPGDEAAATVQRQLEAYNAHDLEGFMATYADDAQLFEYPAKLLATGSTEVRERYAARFQEPNLHAHLVNRIVMGNLVIDQEQVTRSFLEGPGKLELVAIYEVQRGRIARATFCFGAKTLDAKPA